MYLSIDFEDFNHDLKRSLGVSKNGDLKVKELWNKYDNINKFLKENCEGKSKFITFFCTGIIAEKAPDLIHKISNDGHEIACHYYYHDFLINQKTSEIKKNLQKAIELLEHASNQEIKGFRAPNFAINKKIT